jgi:hypothetical protein
MTGIASPFRGMEIHFANGRVKLLKKYPGTWRCEVTILDGKSRVVKKSIRDSQIAEWIAAAGLSAEPLGERHPNCASGCFVFDSESEHRAPCEARCHLMQSSQKDWHETRKSWNEQGLCAREVCRADLSDGRKRHPTTQLLYCDNCARLLSTAQNVKMETV